jgi:hypothetical protein
MPIVSLPYYLLRIGAVRRRQIFIFIFKLSRLALMFYTFMFVLSKCLYVVGHFIRLKEFIIWEQIAISMIMDWIEVCT